jgi:hypothetical protein
MTQVHYSSLVLSYEWRIFLEIKWLSYSFTDKIEDQYRFPYISRRDGQIPADQVLFEVATLGTIHRKFNTELIYWSEFLELILNNSSLTWEDSTWAEVSILFSNLKSQTSILISRSGPQDGRDTLMWEKFSHRNKLREKIQNFDFQASMIFWLPWCHRTLSQRLYLKRRSWEV